MLRIGMYWVAGQLDLMNSRAGLVGYLIWSVALLELPNRNLSPEGLQGWSRLPKNLGTKGWMGGIYVPMSQACSLSQYQLLCNNPKFSGSKQPLCSLAALTWGP